MGTRTKHSFPPSTIIRQIPFSMSRSFRIARGPSGGYSRIENDIRTDKKGRDTRLKGTRSVSANVNFHLDDSISPSPPSVHPERRKKILVSRARQWFPARFLGNRTFGTFVIDGFRENAISSLLRGRLKRWDVYENPWIRKRMRESCFHSWFLLILIVNLSIYITYWMEKLELNDNNVYRIFCSFNTLTFAV